VKAAVAALVPSYALAGWVQQGVLHAYLFYILAAVVVTLTWVSLRGWAVR
jgi:hypothetical protein